MDKHKDNEILLMQSDLAKYCKEVILMENDTDIDVCKFGKQWIVSINAMRREYGDMK